MRLSSFLIYLICWTSTAEEITIALPFNGNPPYSYGQGNPEKGLYIELFNLIFAKTPYTVKYIYLPNARIRSAFINGAIDIECCPTPMWRQEEKAISRYSDRIFQTNDRYVFAKGKILNTEAIDGKVIATILGYGYKDENLFKRFEVNSEIEMLQLITNKRISIGIIDEKIAHYLASISQLEISLGDIHEQVNRTIRVHHSKAYILPSINQAIKEAKNKNLIDNIFQKYTTI